MAHLSFPIIEAKLREYADAAHLIGLLRALSDWSTDCRAAEKRDELALLYLAVEDIDHSRSKDQEPADERHL